MNSTVRLSTLLAVIMISSFFVSSCGKGGEGNSPSGQQVPKNIDYSRDLTGRWAWIARQGKDIVGMGAFVLTQEKESLKGMTEAYVPARPGYRGNKEATLTIRRDNIEGKVSGDQVDFFLKNPPLLISNHAVIKDNGMKLEGSTSQQGIIEGKRITANYTWEATRVLDTPSPVQR